MTEPWHSCISGELEKVEDLMLHDLESENPELTEMCQYVISSGGKRLRPALCIMSYGAVGGKDMMKPVKVGAAFEIIHSATLVHDDINDQGEIRRGRKTLHKEYTVSKAIIAGDYMFAMGFRLLAAEAPQIVDYIVDASASMGAGEFVQKDFEHASSVTEDDYIEIITGKTAKLGGRLHRDHHRQDGQAVRGVLQIRSRGRQCGRCDAGGPRQLRTLHWSGVPDRRRHARCHRRPPQYRKGRRN